MSLPMRNIIATYNIKNRDGAQRWDHDRVEHCRLQRLAEVRAAVQCGRPPRPTAHGQAVARTASAGRRMPRRQRSLPAVVAPQAAEFSSEQRSGANGLDAALSWQLSPGRRERDAQQYLNTTEQAEALRAEMQDWYFAPSSSSSGHKVAKEQHSEPGLEAHALEHMVATPDWEVPPAVVEARRRSPYALDVLRQRPRSAGRPQSTPPVVSASVQPRYSAASGQPRRPPSGPRTVTKQERHEARLNAQEAAYGPLLSDKPSLDLIAKAAAEVPQQRLLEEASAAQAVSVAQRTQPPARPVHVQHEAPPATADTEASERSSPDLTSAQAINDYLAQANQRMASIFSNGPTADNQSRENSQSGLGDALVRPDTTSPAKESLESVHDQAGSAPQDDLSARRDNLDCSADSKASLGAGVACNVSAEQRSPAATPGTPSKLCGAGVQQNAPLAAAPQVGLAGSASAHSDSDHFSEDAFEDGDASIEASGPASPTSISAAVMSDRGSEASVSFDAPGAAPDASASRKIEAGATNASITYDEDFEAADADEEDTLGASIGGA